MNAINLRTKMMKEGFTLTRLAKCIGISYGSLANKMSGRSSFTQAEISKIAAVLHFERSDILDIFFDEKVS